VSSLLTQAIQAFKDADTALKAGDLATYQKKNKEAADLVDKATRQLGANPSGSSTTTTTAPSSA
jgi:hypothetical protein